MSDPIAERITYLSGHVADMDNAIALLDLEMAGRSAPLKSSRESAQAELDALTGAQEAVAVVEASGVVIG